MEMRSFFMIEHYISEILAFISLLERQLQISEMFFFQIIHIFNKKGVIKNQFCPFFPPTFATVVCYYVSVMFSENIPEETIDFFYSVMFKRGFYKHINRKKKVVRP